MIKSAEDLHGTHRAIANNLFFSWVLSQQKSEVPSKDVISVTEIQSLD